MRGQGTDRLASGDCVGNERVPVRHLLEAGCVVDGGVVDVGRLRVE